MSRRQQQYDGKRGSKGMNGWWISMEEAKLYTVGNEAWWLQQDVVEQANKLQQASSHHDNGSPPDKPIWMFCNGDMYLGQWKVSKQYGRPIEHGMGVTYIHNPQKFRGVVYVGGMKEGLFHGAAKAFWLDSAPTWIKNELGDSGIRQPQGDKLISRPYSYTGKYVNNVETDAKAVVVLKDGTTRKGPWKDGKPLGDWWKDHRSVTAAPPRRSSASSGKSSLSSRARTRDASSSTKRKQPSSKGGDVLHNTRAKKKASTPKSRNSSKRPAIVSPPARRSIGRDTTTGRAARDEDVDDETVASGESRTGDPAAAPAVITDEDRMEQIAEWLSNVIGYDPNKAEMKKYAKKFMELGLHSSQMIVDVLPANRVSSFKWMKEFHRRQLVSNGNLKH